MSHRAEHVGALGAVADRPAGAPPPPGGRPDERRRVRRDGPWRITRALLVVSSALCLASCGTGGAATQGNGRAGRPGVQRILSRRVRGLGTILVDAAGYTLYAYIPDRQGPSKCAGHCAVEWPPLLLPRGSSSASAGAGVRSSLLGTTRRPDGRLQVTYDRWPLYLYEQDTSPGEITGQGETMGLWYVVGADGAIDRGIVPAASEG